MSNWSRTYTAITPAHRACRFVQLSHRRFSRSAIVFGNLLKVMSSMLTPRSRLHASCRAEYLAVLQSASTEYFRKVRGFLMDHGRLRDVPQFVVNPEDTAYTNLTSTCTNTQALNLMPLYLTADTAMAGLAAAATGNEGRLEAARQAAASMDADAGSEDDAVAEPARAAVDSGAFR